MFRLGQVLLYIVPNSEKKLRINSLSIFQERLWLKERYFATVIMTSMEDKPFERIRVAELLKGYRASSRKRSVVAARSPLITAVMPICMALTPNLLTIYSV
jgi:hypothetical protein